MGPWDTQTPVPARPPPSPGPAVTQALFVSRAPSRQAPRPPTPPPTFWESGDGRWHTPPRGGAHTGRSRPRGRGRAPSTRRARRRPCAPAFPADRAPRGPAGRRPGSPPRALGSGTARARVAAPGPSFPHPRPGLRPPRGVGRVPGRALLQPRSPLPAGRARTVRCTWGSGTRPLALPPPPPPPLRTPETESESGAREPHAAAARGPRGWRGSPGCGGSWEGETRPGAARRRQPVPRRELTDQVWEAVGLPWGGAGGAPFLTRVISSACVLGGVFFIIIILVLLLLLVTSVAAELGPNERAGAPGAGS